MHAGANALCARAMLVGVVGPASAGKATLVDTLVGHHSFHELVRRLTRCRVRPMPRRARLTRVPEDRGHPLPLRLRYGDACGPHFEAHRTVGAFSPAPRRGCASGLLRAGDADAQPRKRRRGPAPPSPGSERAAEATEHSSTLSRCRDAVRALRQERGPDALAAAAWALFMENWRNHTVIRWPLDSIPDIRYLRCAGALLPRRKGAGAETPVPDPPTPRARRAASAPSSSSTELQRQRSTASSDTPCAAAGRGWGERRHSHSRRGACQAALGRGALSLDRFVARDAEEFTRLQSAMQMCDDVIVNDGSQHQLARALVLRTERGLAHRRPRPPWDTYFMRLAFLAARRSNCMKRRVGAIVVRDNRVVSTGYNGTPRSLTNCMEGGCPRCNANAGCVSPARPPFLRRPDNPLFLCRPCRSTGAALDQCLCLHAEENAIMEAGTERARSCTIYSTSFPCLQCTKRIIQVVRARAAQPPRQGTRARSDSRRLAAAGHSSRGLRGGVRH